MYLNQGLIKRQPNSCIKEHSSSPKLPPQAVSVSTKDWWLYKKKKNSSGIINDLTYYLLSIWKIMADNDGFKITKQNTTIWKTMADKGVFLKLQGKIMSSQT